MASTYSTNLALELQATGENAGSWGTITNTNLGTLIEQAISGYVAEPMADADQTITIPNGASGTARNMFIECTGALTANRNLVVPANKKLYFVYNNTTGGYAVTVKVSGQTGVAVPSGKKCALVSNGTDIYEAISAFVGNVSLGGSANAVGTITSGVWNAGAVTSSGTITGAGTLALQSSTANVTFGGTNEQVYRSGSSLKVYVGGADTAVFSTTGLATSTGYSITANRNGGNIVVNNPSGQYSELYFSNGGTLKTNAYYDNSGSTFNIVNGGAGGVSLANGGTSWSALSDERMKDITGVIDKPLARLAAIRGLFGKYKTDPDGKSRAFLIAQDVQKVFPEAVGTMSVKGVEFLSLAYTELIPLLVAALNELAAEVESLRK